MKRARLAACLAGLPCLGGCLFMHHSTRIIRDGEQRQQIAFESDLAQRVFESRALNDEAREKEGSSSVVAIPFLLWWSHSRVRSPQAWYNDAIRRCDKDRDRCISEGEALAYNPNFAVETASPTSIELEPEPAVQQAGFTERASTRKSSDKRESSGAAQ